MLRAREGDVLVFEADERGVVLRVSQPVNVFAEYEGDWAFSERVWREAALAFRRYAERRRSQPGGSGPRRILANFIVGAHALHLASALLMLDLRVYRASFPELEVLTPG